MYWWIWLELLAFLWELETKSPSVVYNLVDEREFLIFDFDGLVSKAYKGGFFVDDYFNLGHCRSDNDWRSAKWGTISTINVILLIIPTTMIYPKDSKIAKKEQDKELTI